MLNQGWLRFDRIFQKVSALFSAKHNVRVGYMYENIIYLIAHRTLNIQLRVLQHALTIPCTPLYTHAPTSLKYALITPPHYARPYPTLAHISYSPLQHTSTPLHHAHPSNMHNPYKTPAGTISPCSTRNSKVGKCAVFQLWTHTYIRNLPNDE